MNRQDLVAAIVESERFTKKAKVLLELAKDDEIELWRNPKQWGPVRSASMDLTRALAEMRARK